MPKHRQDFSADFLHVIGRLLRQLTVASSMAVIRSLRIHYTTPYYGFTAPEVAQSFSGTKCPRSGKGRFHSTTAVPHIGDSQSHPMGLHLWGMRGRIPGTVLHSKMRRKFYVFPDL